VFILTAFGPPSPANTRQLLANYQPSQTLMSACHAVWTALLLLHRLNYSQLHLVAV